MYEESILELEKQRDKAREVAIGSTSLYDTYLALALSDDKVLELLKSRLKDGIINGAKLLQTQPIALLEFDIASRTGVNLICSNVMIGIHPTTKTVSTDPASMFSSEEEPISALPFTLRIPSSLDDFHKEVNSSFSDQEDTYRKKVGAPTLEQVRKLDKLATLSGSGLTEQVGFGHFGPIDGFGKHGSVSPVGGSRYTKCFSTTRGGDGYYVNDDCG